MNEDFVDWDANLAGVLEEVQFASNVSVADCFASALKCYRIQTPNVIQLVEQNLQDEHVQKLCEFLKDRNMVIRLNLRRNKIGNAGAEALGKLLQFHDNTITHMDLTRNLIGTDGG
jgi:tRNA A-37 threonylcarbamoyl transferase component Bud32